MSLASSSPTDAVPGAGAAPRAAGPRPVGASPGLYCLYDVEPHDGHWALVSTPTRLACKVAACVVDLDDLVGEIAAPSLPSCVLERLFRGRRVEFG